MGRIGRVLGIVAVLGLACGALTAALSIVIAELVDGQGSFGWRVTAQIAAAAATYGGVLGAVLLPLAGFTAFRRVPLWRLLVGTSLGTAIGIGGVWGWNLPEVLTPIVGFGLGAVGAGLLTRKRTARSNVHASAHDPAGEESARALEAGLPDLPPARPGEPVSRGRKKR